MVGLSEVGSPANVETEQSYRAACRCRSFCAEVKGGEGEGEAGVMGSQRQQEIERGERKRVGKRKGREQKLI